jgi:hypothetical protein
MKIIVVFAVFICCTGKSLCAQPNKIKMGFFGLPLQSGFGIGYIGFEHHVADSRNSWQVSLNASGGSPAADAPTHSRKWITFERNHYFNPVEKQTRILYTLFVEAGTRRTYPGYKEFPANAVLNKETNLEIDPGVGLGVQYRIGERWGIELVAGPKIRFAWHKDYYYNATIQQPFTTKYQSTESGYRVMAGITFQL